MEINREEVLRYLGSAAISLDSELEQLLEDCIREIKEIARPQYTFEVCRIEINANEVSVRDKGLGLKGFSLSKHLQGAEEAIIMAATLGAEVDRIIRRHQYTNLTRTVILDACASTAIEAVCDEVELQLRRSYGLKALHLTSRFSPGYGDLSIAYQGKILELLKAQQRIGLMVTEEGLLIPRKSVTAIMGITEAPPEAGLLACDVCGMRKDCKMRREEGSCGTNAGAKG